MLTQRVLLLLGIPIKLEDFAGVLSDESVLRVAHCSTGAGNLQLSLPQSQKHLEIPCAHSSAPLAADLALTAPPLLVQRAGRDRMLGPLSNDDCLEIDSPRFLSWEP